MPVTVLQGRRRARAAVAVGLLVPAAAAPALAGPAGASAARAPSGRGIVLPAAIHGVDPLAAPGLGLRPDRLRRSSVPGPVRNREDVTVRLGPDGAPAAVVDTQRLLVTGQGGYVVRELGPARDATGLGGTVPPVLELGTVVWQGFSPGRRALAARLTLDPGIEAARLPLQVRVGFRDSSGRARPLGAGLAAPADGTVTITLRNNTATPMTVPLGTGPAATVARLLDTLRRAAARGSST